MGPVDTTEAEVERIAGHGHESRLHIRRIGDMPHMRAIHMSRNTICKPGIHHGLHWQDGDLPQVCKFGTTQASVSSILDAGIAADGTGRRSTKRNDLHLVEGSFFGCEERGGVRDGSEVGVEVNIKMAKAWHGCVQDLQQRDSDAWLRTISSSRSSSAPALW